MRPRWSQQRARPIQCPQLPQAPPALRSPEGQGARHCARAPPTARESPCSRLQQPCAAWEQEVGFLTWLACEDSDTRPFLPPLVPQCLFWGRSDSAPACWCAPASGPAPGMPSSPLRRIQTPGSPRPLLHPGKYSLGVWSPTQSGPTTLLSGQKGVSRLGRGKETWTPGVRLGFGLPSLGAFTSVLLLCLRQPQPRDQDPASGTRMHPVLNLLPFHPGTG